MTLKQVIVAELGQSELLLPELIARSLTANDQAKYYFALLQAAGSNAETPRIPAIDLKTERIASGLPDKWLDDVVASTKKSPTGYAVPNVGNILERIRIAILTMLACLEPSERRSFENRLSRLKIADGNGAISSEQIDAMTSGDREAGDSLHLIVMDAHRAINALQTTTATELLDGACVYGLSSWSRPLVAAFMKGVNRTLPLKFNHPGLGTTATEHDGRLLIQNDIGTTDAHVLIVRVSGNTATLTYTDIHPQRLEFFQSLFTDFAVKWTGTDLRSSSKSESGSYLLSTGTYRTNSQKDLEAYLQHLGSRIVFLIDWNHMRKRLRAFVGKKQSIELLKWAADHDYGHRGLIEVGGERALADAVEYASGQKLHYGDRLDDLIGEAAAIDFLRDALRSAATGLLARRSRRAVLDEIKARLKHHFESAGLAIFDLASRHAACGYDIAYALREAIFRTGTGSEKWTAKLGERAIAWEAKADQLLNDARDDAKRFGRPLSLVDFLNYADDAVDELEEAASLLGLMSVAGAANTLLVDLRKLADLALSSCQELVKCIECAATITRSDMRDDLDDFLAALERLVALEHQADDRKRRLRHLLVAECKDYRAIYLVDQLSTALETATDAYAHAGQALRQYLMEDVIA